MIHDFALTTIHFIFINFLTFSSSLNIVRNIFNIKNNCIFEKIYIFNVKDFSLNKSQMKKNFNKNNLNWFLLSNIVEFLNNESFLKKIFYVVELTFDDA